MTRQTKVSTTSTPRLVIVHADGTECPVFRICYRTDHRWVVR